MIRVQHEIFIVCRFYCVAFIEFGKNVINICVDSSSSIHVDNKKNMS